MARAIARGCAAGLPVAIAIARAADAVDDASADALRAAAERLEAGDGLASALESLTAAPGGSVLVGAIELHADLGGDLVASLFAIADGLADRERLRLEARAATAQARIAARVIPLAPLASAAMLGVLAPDALVGLVTTAPGLAIVGAAAAMTVLALVLLRRIAAGVEG